MPGNNPSPIPAFMAELNLRDFGGVTLFQRVGDGAAVALPALTGTQGRYEDWLDFLNGRASQPGRDLVALATSSFAATTFTVGIDSTDLFYVESDVENFTILAGSSAFGLDGTETTTGAGPFRMTASDNWTRGLLQNASIALSSNTSGIFTIPPTSAANVYWSQSVITAIRALGAEGDADDQTPTTLVLETIDNAALATTTTGRIRWMMDDTGHITWAAPSSITSTALTWNSTAMRDMMGFSGNEAVAVVGNVARQVAEFPAKACIVPTRPLERITRESDRVDSAVRITNGNIAGNEVGTYQVVDLEWWVDGPVDSRDLHRHWTERVVPFLTRGSRVSWYGEWGDPRRGLVGFDVAGTQATYDLLYTSEKDGERGRYRGRVAVDWNAPQRVVWPSRMRRRAPATLRIQKAED